MTVAKKPVHRGEHGISRKTIAQGMPDPFGEPVVTLLACLFHFAREAAGASRTRHSLRPLRAKASRLSQSKGARNEKPRADTQREREAAPAGMRAV
jgi:hypothetical protein